MRPTGTDQKCAPHADGAAVSGGASPRRACIARPLGTSASSTGKFPDRPGDAGYPKGVAAGLTGNFSVSTRQLPSRRGKLARAPGTDALPAGKFPPQKGKFTRGKGYLEDEDGARQRHRGNAALKSGTTGPLAASRQQPTSGRQATSSDEVRRPGQEASDRRPTRPLSGRSSCQCI